MPEGDSIAWLATKLRRSILGKTVRNVVAQAIPGDLVGHTVTSIDSRGKNLLVRFDDGRVLHVHLRMLGRVRVESPYLLAQKAKLRGPSRMVPQLRLDFDNAVVIGSRIPVLRLLAPGAEKHALGLESLGPDLLDPDFDENEAVTRLRTMNAKEIGDAVMQQRAVAGIGNVYKSECLFIEKLDPWTLMRDVPDAKLLAILRLAKKLLAMNVRAGRRVTRSALQGKPLWVYNRKGLPCFTCGTAIVMAYQGAAPGRSTYACPKCQAMVERAHGPGGDDHRGDAAGVPELRDQEKA